MLRWLLPAALVACASDGASPIASTEQLRILDVVGTWRWLHRTADDGTARVEDETWTFRADGTGRVVGRYVRSVDVRSTDGQSFACSQQPWYRQRAIFDVVVEATPDGLVARETAVETEPSPCDAAFRALATYSLVPRGNRLELRWDGGSQTLWQQTATATELPAATWPASAQPTGAWRWQTRSYDDDRNIRDEAEWWEITRRTDTVLDATYRRRVTVRSLDGAVILCAGAPTWSFDDTYVLDVEREDAVWHIRERGVAAGTHPCIAPTPARATDEATAEQLGDFLVLEWRGKRRQVLYRP